MDRPTIHLLCGMPGAGKSTLAQELEAEGGGVWLNADRWVWLLFPDDAAAAARDERKDRVERLQWETADQVMLRPIDAACGR